MRKFFTLTSAAVVFASIALTGCVGGPAGPGEGSLDGNLPYPDSGYADAETDSWKQIGEDEGDITIEWYVDSTGYSINTNILNAIYENTGIRVEVSYPATDNSDRLATMIAGDMLPDIIMITDDTVKAQLEEEGYIYSINRLAEKYAPTLLDRISETEFDYYAASDGNLYTLSNNFYTDEAVDAYSEQGKTLLVNGCFNVRKDYLIAYLEHKYGVSSTDDDFWTQAYRETTTPSGFIEMCVWVKQNYNIANNIPLAVIDSNTVNRLQEYFCVPMEDEQGDLLYAYEQAECKEAYMFLKVYLSPIIDLHNNEVISYSISTSPDFGQTKEILKGLFDKLPKGARPILHSDQGWQYQMREFQRQLKEHNILQSMSRKGNCLDNSVMENFFGRLKVEMFYGEKFQTVDEFVHCLKEYIHYWNNERISLKLTN